MMKRTGYLIVLSLITIVCVIYGSIIHLGGFSWGFPFVTSQNSDVNFTTIKTDDGNLSASTISLDEFDNMNIELSVMDLTIEQGNEPMVKYECNKKNLVPSIDVEDGKLIIKQPKMKNIFNIGRVKCKMTITVPKDKDMKDVVITTDTGDVKIADLTGESLSLDTDTGDVKLNKCDFASSKIDGDTGDMKYESCNLGDCEISNDTGDVSLINSDFAGESGSLNIDNDTGDVRIEGCRDLGLFATDLSTDIGDIEVNGTNCKKKYSQEAVSSGQSENNPKIVISTDIGDIRVNQK